MTNRRWAHAARASLRGLVDRCLSAYAETAWVYRYGPGTAPSAPVLFHAPPPRAAAYRVQAVDTAAALARQPSGFRAPGRPARQSPASRSPAHASASA